MESRPQEFSALGTASLDPQQEQEIRQTLQAVRRYVSPGDSIYILGDDGIYYFLGNFHNPTRYANLSFIVGEGMVQEVLRSLEKRPPRAVLARQEGKHLKCKYYQEPIAHFIESHYRVAESVGAYDLWIPR